MALASAQDVLNALLSGATATELQPEVERLPPIELKALLCTACSMREEVIANCHDTGDEVDQLLTQNCELHTTQPQACKVAAVYRLPVR